MLTQVRKTYEIDHDLVPSMLARAMHKASPRRARPFVVIRCTGMPEEQLDIELFGANASTGREHRGRHVPADTAAPLATVLADRQPHRQGNLRRRPAGSTTARARRRLPTARDRN